MKASDSGENVPSLLKSTKQFKKFGSIILHEFLCADRELAILEAVDSPSVTSAIDGLGIGPTVNAVLAALLSCLIGRLWAIGLDEHRKSASLPHCRSLLCDDVFLRLVREEFSLFDKSSIYIIDDDPADPLRSDSLRDAIAKGRTADLAARFEEAVKSLKGNFLPELLESPEADMLRNARCKVTAHKDVVLANDGQLRLKVFSDFGIRHQDIRLFMHRMRKVVSELFLVSNGGLFLLEASERNHKTEAALFWNSFKS